MGELFGLFWEFSSQNLLVEHENAEQRDAHFVQMRRRLCRITRYAIVTWKLSFYLSPSQLFFEVFAARQTSGMSFYGSRNDSSRFAPRL